MKLIGRIKYETKGAYDPAATYRAMDVVLYSGSLWEALKDTTGNPPPENQRNEDGSPASNEFWQLFLPGALGDDYVKKTDIAKAPTETEQGKVGVVMPDGKTIQIDENGLLTGTPLNFMGTLKELQEGLTSGEITEGMIGYVKGTPDNPEDPDHPNNILIHIDDYLSLVSSNAVQNRIITAELNLIKELVEQNKQLIEETKALRASVEEFGLSKICPVGVTDVTENNGIVLGAVEKNESIEGTISNIFSNRLSSLINKLFASVVLLEKFHLDGGIMQTVNLTGSIDEYKLIVFIFEWTGFRTIYDQKILQTTTFRQQNRDVVLFSPNGEESIHIWNHLATSIYLQMSTNENVFVSIVAIGKI